MRKDKVEFKTVKSYFHYLYGDPAAGTDDTWFMKPWYYAAMLTKNYVFLLDPKNEWDAFVKAEKSEIASLLKDTSAVAIIST